MTIGEQACGLSRPSFYQAQAAFELGGLLRLLRLLRHNPSPHGAYKFSHRFALRHLS